MDKMIELNVPAEKQMLLVIRLTTAGVMARAGLTVDILDDLKMAVEEACDCLITHTRCGEIHVAYLMRDGELTIRVDGKGGEEGRDADPCETQVIRCILESMVDRVELIHEGESLRAISMVKRISA